MSVSKLPPAKRRAPLDSQRKAMLIGATGLLVLSAVVIFLSPIRLNIFLKLAVAVTNIIAASVIWLLLRQRDHD